MLEARLQAGSPGGPLSPGGPPRLCWEGVSDERPFPGGRVSCRGPRLPLAD